MALESKSLQVKPSNENNALILMQSFGWTLLSSQEIYNRSQEFTGTTYDPWGATHNYETTETHYVKMVFQRDTNIANYSELVQLENKYDNLEIPKYVHDSEPKYFHPQQKSKKLIGGLMFLGIPLIIVGIAIIFEGVFGNGMGTEDEYIPMIVLGIVGLIMMIIAISFIKGNKKKVQEARDSHTQKVNEWRVRFEQYEKDIHNLKQQRQQIVEKAQSLLT